MLKCKKYGWTYDKLNPILAILEKRPFNPAEVKKYKDHLLHSKKGVRFRAFHPLGRDTNWVVKYHFEGDTVVLDYTGTHKEVYGSENIIRSDAKMRITKRNQSARIVAADEDEFMFDDAADMAEEDISDSLDTMSDGLDDLMDAVDDIEEDDIDIEIDNNIANHYIAECDSCHGVFISALVETDQEVDMISGTCPLCGKDTDQYLKWIIKEV